MVYHRTISRGIQRSSRNALLKYLVFAGDRHRPNGGMQDFIGDSNNLAESENLIKKWFDSKSQTYGVYFAWAHIWDSELRKLILEVSDAPLGKPWYKALHFKALAVS